MSERKLSRSSLPCLLLTAAFLWPASSGAGDLLFEQYWDTLAYYDSTLTPVSDREVADDFDLSASIERVVVGGTAVTPEGVWVRFYDGTTDEPGALQAEYYLAAGDPGLIIGSTDAARFDITLPQPFLADGHHYVSVQAVAPGPWFWWNAELSSASGTSGFTRQDGGAWTTVLDVCFSLYGTLLGPGQIDSLGETSLPRSGFLEIFGNGFGSPGQVLVDGAPAIVGTWTNGRIAAYVPESAGPGVVPVQVVNEGGTSNSVDLEVALRQQQGRELWHLRLDTLYSLVRPAVGPDGTIYAVDVHDTLYAASPEGALLWLVKNAGSKGIDVDDQGVIYTGNEDWVKAFNPDGTERWTYGQTPRAFVTQDIAVGPDGNVYVLATSGLGIFSLTPEGELRWATPEPYDRPFVGYTEIVFGPGPDDNDQLYFSANRNTRAIRLEDGAEVFRMGSIGTLAVSPVDATLHGSYFAYFPDGTFAWQFDEFLNGTPTIGSSGTHYSTTSMITPRLYAINPDGSERWSSTLSETAYKVDVDPTESQIVMGTYDVLTTPAAMLGANAANGHELWRFELPVQDPDIPNPATGGMGFNQFVGSRTAFSSDGSAAYVMTAIATGGMTTDRAFLYALDLGSGGPPPPPTGLLRSVEINFRARSRRGRAAVRGFVSIEDENGAAVGGATVHATWTLPDGSTSSSTAVTNGNGKGRFNVLDDTGLFVLTIDDVTKEGYVFDTDNSVLSGSTEVF